MGHERPEEGRLPAVTGGASWRGVQQALHSVLKASRVQMGRGNGRPVFKEYCRPCRVKNSDRARKPDLGAFKATTSSTVPSTTPHIPVWRRPPQHAQLCGHPPWWLAPTAPCNAGRIPTIGPIGGPLRHPIRWPPRSSEPMSPRAPQSQLAHRVVPWWRSCWWPQRGNNKMKDYTNNGMQGAPVP